MVDEPEGAELSQINVKGNGSGARKYMKSCVIGERTIQSQEVNHMRCAVMLVVSVFVAEVYGADNTLPRF